MQSVLSYLRRSVLKHPVAKHILAWLLFAAYEQLTVLFTATPNPNKFAIILNYLLNACLFYANSEWLLPRLQARGRSLLYAFAAIVVLALYALVRTEMYWDFFPRLGLDLRIASSYGQLWVLSLYRGSFFQFASIGYWYARHAIQLERQRREHDAQLRATEKSLIEADLAYLRSQINPHFLFNSLNFLYAQVYPHSEGAAKGILLLSDIMRYALQKENNGKVMLGQEVQHLRNYIAINQLRFSSQLQVDFEVSGNVEYLMILPLVLITFVENCFKHGELTEAAHPVTILLELRQNQLTFQTRNKISLGPKEQSTGIGLNNTMRRLELVYPNRYNLQVSEEAGYYTCNLFIDL